MLGECMTPMSGTNRSKGDSVGRESPAAMPHPSLRLAAARVWPRVGISGASIAGRGYYSNRSGRPVPADSEWHRLPADDLRLPVRQAQGPEPVEGEAAATAA